MELALANANRIANGAMDITADDPASSAAGGCAGGAASFSMDGVSGKGDSQEQVVPVADATFYKIAKLSCVNERHAVAKEPRSSTNEALAASEWSPTGLAY